jgi:hypothetical protein
MHIRRPLAALLTALALTGGGVLTACTSPTNGNTGTPDNTAVNTNGGNPGGASQGNLPNNSNQQSGTSNGSDRAGGNHKGTP